MTWLDEPILWYTTIPFLLSLVVTIALVNYARRKNAVDMEKIMSKTRKKIANDTASGLNAIQRVSEKGGKVTYRDDIDKMVSTHTLSVTTDVVIAKDEQNEKQEDEDLNPKK